MHRLGKQRNGPGMGRGEGGGGKREDGGDEIVPERDAVMVERLREYAKNHVIGYVEGVNLTDCEFALDGPGVSSLVASLGHPGRRRVVLSPTFNTLLHVITKKSHHVLSKFMILC